MGEGLLPEASQTIAGSLNMTKSSWQNLLTEFSKSDGDIEGAFNNFMTSIEALGKKLISSIRENTK